MGYEEQKAEREFRQNPPETAPGQGSSEGWGSDILDSMPSGSSSVESMDNLYNTDINQTLNNNQNNSTGTQPQAMQTQLQGMNKLEDALAEGAIVAGKGLWAYTKALVASVKDNKSGDWHRLGVRITKLSSAFALLGVFFCMLKPFLKNNNTPIDLVIGSLLSMMCGIGLCMNFDKEQKEEGTSEGITDYEIPNYSFDDINETSIDYSESIYNEEISDPYSDTNEGYSLWDDIEDEEEFFFEENTSYVDSSDFNLNDAISEVPEISQGTQTRQYLFETFTRVLPLITPSFATMNQIEDYSDTFYEFEDYLRSSAYQVGTKEENIPELESLYENDFIYRLNCTRPVGIKEQAIADEIASAFSRDDNNMVIRSGVYATTETSVGKFTVNLFKGSLEGQSSAITISLGDVYREVSSYVLNPKISMPFVWGINEFGKPLYCDLINCDSIIISGEADGGKSWKGQSIVAQLCMFHSPKELELYIFDHKNTASDYRYLAETLPHAKYFCGDPRKINDGIQKIVDTALNERSVIFEKEGCVSIKEYNQRNECNKLPYIYIIIDELMSLMDFFALNDKDEQARFKNLMSTIVSKLRYIGVRVVLFPHRIVDSVIGKNTYSLISSRAVVRQLSQDEIKNATGSTQKEFPYSLVNKGDMAIKTKDIANGTTTFCHAEVITSSNEGNKRLYDFIGAVWKRLEPDSTTIKINGMIGGSIGKQVKPTKPIDNTEGMKPYAYEGYNSGESVKDVVEDSVDMLDTDSSFWGDFMSS